MSEKKKIFIHKYLTEHRINDEKKTIEEFLRDGEKGIFIGGSGDIEYQIEYLMDLDKDDQITSLEKFNSFYENKGDLGLFLSTHKIPELLSSNEIKEIDSELKPYNLKFNDIKENFYSLNLYFNDNSIAINYGTQENEIEYNPSWL